MFWDDIRFLVGTLTIIFCAPIFISGGFYTANYLFSEKPIDCEVGDNSQTDH
jgi:hypothetical protein